MRLMMFAAFLLACAAYIVTEASKCSRHPDIIFDMDTSSSITDDDFRWQRKFITSFTRKFKIAKHKTRLGVIYNTETQPDETAQLGRQNSFSRFKDIVQGLGDEELSGEERNQDLGLGKALQHFDRYKFSGKKRPKVLVVLNKGIRNIEKRKLGPYVRRLRKKNVEVYAIGVPSSRSPVKKKHLRPLVESSEDVFTYKSFYHLSRKKEVEKIAEHICTGRAGPGFPPASAIYNFDKKKRGLDTSGNDAPPAYISPYLRLYRGPYKPRPGYSFYLPGHHRSYIEIPNRPGGKLDLDKSITILLWVYPLYRPGPIVNFRRDRYGFGLYYGRDWRGTYIKSRFTFRGRPWSTRTIRYRVYPRRWYYVGMTYDYDTGMGGLWIDKGGGYKRRIRRRIHPRLHPATQYPIRLGKLFRKRQRFQGKVSCLQFYDTVLTGVQMEVVKDICEPEDPCAKLPCQNGGSCIASKTTESYRCRCPTYYYGRHCEGRLPGPPSRPTDRPTGPTSTSASTPRPSSSGCPGVPGTSFIYLEPFRIRILEYINVFRRLHGVPPVIPSKPIHDAAQKWALRISSLGTARRDPKSPYGSTICIRRGQRPILAKECVFEWYNDVLNYNWRTHEPKLPSLEFSQLIWKESLYAGVGGVKGPRGRFYVVVYFDPPGNKKPDMKTNVPPYTDVFLTMPQVPCQKGYTESNGNCYKPFNSKEPWVDAVKTCTRENATLLTVHSMQDIDTINVIPVLGKDGPLWTGLNDRQDTGMYTHIDGSGIEYLDWKPYEPGQGDQHCVSMSVRDISGMYGTMADRKCKDKHQFMCRKPKEGLVTYRVTLDLSDTVWVPDLGIPGTLANLQLKKKFEDTLMKIYKNDRSLVSAMVEDFRTPGVKVQCVLRFGLGAKPDPTIPLHTTLSSNGGKFPAPLNKKAKITKLEILKPGEGPAIIGHCHQVCQTTCFHHCNPLCCTSRVAIHTPNPLMTNMYLQQQTALMQKLQPGFNPGYNPAAMQAQLANMVRSHLPSQKRLYNQGPPSPNCVIKTGSACPLAGQPVLKPLSLPCVPQPGTPCPPTNLMGMSMSHQGLRAQGPMMGGAGLPCVPRYGVPCPPNSAPRPPYGRPQMQQPLHPLLQRLQLQRQMYKPAMSTPCIPGMGLPCLPGQTPMQQMQPIQQPKVKVKSLQGFQLGSSIPNQPYGAMNYPVFGMYGTPVPGKPTSIVYPFPSAYENVFPFYSPYHLQQTCGKPPLRPCPTRTKGGRSRSVVLPPWQGGTVKLHRVLNYVLPRPPFQKPPQKHPLNKNHNKALTGKRPVARKIMDTSRKRGYRGYHTSNVLRRHPFFAPLYPRPVNPTFSPYTQTPWQRPWFSPFVNPWMQSPPLYGSPFSGSQFVSPQIKINDYVNSKGPIPVKGAGLGVSPLQGYPRFAPSFPQPLQAFNFPAYSPYPPYANPWIPRPLLPPPAQFQPLMPMAPFARQIRPSLRQLSKMKPMSVQQMNMIYDTFPITASSILFDPRPLPLRKPCIPKAGGKPCPKPAKYPVPEPFTQRHLQYGPSPFIPPFAIGPMPPMPLQQPLPMSIHTPPIPRQKPFGPVMPMRPFPMAMQRLSMQRPYSGHTPIMQMPFGPQTHLPPTPSFQSPLPGGMPLPGVQSQRQVHSPLKLPPIALKHPAPPKRPVYHPPMPSHPMLNHLPHHTAFQHRLPPHPQMHTPFGLPAHLNPSGCNLACLHPPGLSCPDYCSKACCAKRG